MIVVLLVNHMPEKIKNYRKTGNDRTTHHHDYGFESFVFGLL